MVQFSCQELYFLTKSPGPHSGSCARASKLADSAAQVLKYQCLSFEGQSRGGLGRNHKVICVLNKRDN